MLYTTVIVTYVYSERNDIIDFVRQGQSSVATGLPRSVNTLGS